MSVLSEKDANAQLSPSKSQSSNDFAATTKQADGEKSSMLKQISGGSGTYVSPSDAIMSPASQKLASFKQKQINKQNDRAKRSLFARTLSSNSEGSNKSLDDWE